MNFYLFINHNDLLFLFSLKPIKRKYNDDLVLKIYLNKYRFDNNEGEFNATHI